MINWIARKKLKAITLASKVNLHLAYFFCLVSQGPWLFYFPTSDLRYSSSFVSFGVWFSCGKNQYVVVQCPSIRIFDSYLLPWNQGCQILHVVPGMLEALELLKILELMVIYKVNGQSSTKVWTKTFHMKIKNFTGFPWKA